MRKKIKVAIIGAGWYGCHIGLALKNKGIDVIIYDKQKEIFAHASSKNQNRLHLGFHYPRSYSTREQSRAGYYKFLNCYKHLCRNVNNNIYAVDDKKSLVDFETYKAIMRSSELHFTEENKYFNRFKNLDGFIQVKEKMIDFEAAKNYFYDNLIDNLVLNKEIHSDAIHQHESYISIFENNYDYLINCTWGRFRPFTQIEIFYEPCITFLYRTTTEEFALTIMDGEFLSLYPYSKNFYTLTSVRNTPLGQFDDISSAENRIAMLEEEEIITLREKFKSEILYYYPSFSKLFTYENYYTSIKTKLNVKNDNRQAIVQSNGREIYVLSGKIDTIFYAEEKIFNHLFGGT